jgi:hypothetical protein
LNSWKPLQELLKQSHLAELKYVELVMGLKQSLEHHHLLVVDAADKDFKQ